METLKRINAAASTAVKAARKAAIDAKGAIIGPTDQLYTIIEVPGGYAVNRKSPARYGSMKEDDVSDEIFSTPEQALNHLVLHTLGYSGAHLADPEYAYMETLHGTDGDGVSSSYAIVRQITGLALAVEGHRMGPAITWKPKE